jgi:putative ABC transport system substrate-binding protein
MVMKIVVFLGATVVLLFVGLLAQRCPADAQQATRVPRIGFLGSGRSMPGPYIRVFRQGLRDQGYIEGENVHIEYRFDAEGKADRLSELAAELVQVKVDVIVTNGRLGVLAAKKATGIIPIVFVGIGDPVATGLVASLSRPGGNATGSSQSAPELGGKRLEILKEAFPTVTRVAYFWDPGLAGMSLKGMREAAPKLGLNLQTLEIRDTNDFEVAFEESLKGRVHGITVAPVPIIIAHRNRVFDFAAKNRLPAVYPDRDWAEAGGLMSYGVNFTDLFRRSTLYVDKILKGAKPADLPVEQSTRFELMINLNTAKRSGLNIPEEVLRWADEIIR